MPQMRHKNLGYFFSTLVCGALKDFMKALKAFTKPFLKKCENKKFHKIHFGKKSRNTKNRKG